MKIILTVIFLLPSFYFFGQIKPEIFPEDLHIEEIQVRCFCKPGVANKSRSKGVKLNYGWLGRGTYNQEENTILSGPKSIYNRLSSVEFSLKVPAIRKENFKFLLGYKHASERFNFRQIGNDFNFAFRELSDEVLKSNSISVIASKSFNEFSYAVLRLSYSADGDYNGWMSFDQKYAIYKIYAMYARKPHDDFEWGIGAAASKNFRRTAAIPIILINKNFNQRWGIESVLPVFVLGRYNINAGNIMLFGAEFDSQSYRIDVDEDRNPTPYAYAYNHSELIFSVRLEHQFSSWVWANIKVGFQRNFSSDFEAKNDLSPFFQVDPSDSFIFKVGVFVSPPDSFK